jgi:hypothetical protein
MGRATWQAKQSVLHAKQAMWQGYHFANQQVKQNGTQQVIFVSMKLSKHPIKHQVYPQTLEEF